MHDESLFHEMNFGFVISCMKYVLLLLPWIAVAQQDPAWEAYRAWQEAHPRVAGTSVDRGKALFDASSEWVSKWPDSKLAWEERRQALMDIHSNSAEEKRIGENLLRLNPKHTWINVVASDWTAHGVNLEDAEKLLSDEIVYQDSLPPFVRPAQPTLADLVDEASSAGRGSGYLVELAEAQLSRRETAAARKTIQRYREYLETAFQRYYDQDPMEAFPDHWSRYYTLSARLAELEQRWADAALFMLPVVSNPFFHREYGDRSLSYAKSLWIKGGGSEDAWQAVSKVPPLPKGAPTMRGVALFPWLALDYPLPALNARGPGGETWTNSVFEGKTTIVYLWASWCAPCWTHLKGIQDLYDKIKDRQDIQIVTLSADEDMGKLVSFMKEKGYTFPVIVSPQYVKTVLPQLILGQHWIVDGTGHVRLQRTSSSFNGAEQAFVDESIYKLLQIREK
jgi:peroxiredoxin